MLAVLIPARLSQGSLVSSRNPSHVNQSDYATETAAGEHARGIAGIQARGEVRIGRREIRIELRGSLQVWLRLFAPGTGNKPRERWADESAGNGFVRHMWLKTFPSLWLV